MFVRHFHLAQTGGNLRNVAVSEGEVRLHGQANFESPQRAFVPAESRKNCAQLKMGDWKIVKERDGLEAALNPFLESPLARKRDAQTVETLGIIRIEL